jgi:hypothetical protein
MTGSNSEPAKVNADELTPLNERSDAPKSTFLYKLDSIVPNSQDINANKQHFLCEMIPQSAIFQQIPVAERSRIALRACADITRSVCLSRSQTLANHPLLKLLQIITSSHLTETVYYLTETIY